jgi:hypothetical protein
MGENLENYVFDDATIERLLAAEAIVPAVQRALDWRITALRCCYETASGFYLAGGRWGGSPPMPNRWLMP